MEKRKFSVFIGNMGTCNERHCQEYSSIKYTYEQLFERAASIKLISGVDLVSDDIFWSEFNKIKGYLKKYNLKAVSIVPDFFGKPLWKQGSLSSLFAEAREKAIEDGKRTKDAAEELGCEFITIWPGQDGFDYMFQADYITERTWFADGVREICRYKPNIGVALEYKLREPRTHNYISTVGTTILTVKEVGEKNCGIALDYGHALFSYEIPAESVALMKKWGGNLMHIHINDNYCYSDDDMIVGSVHTLDYLEWLFWLRKTGYNGWFTMDQFPYREDGRDAVNESVQWLDAMMEIVDKADEKEFESVIKKKDAVLTSRYARKLLLGK
jgi:xylose isomerase